MQKVTTTFWSKSYPLSEILPLKISGLAPDKYCVRDIDEEATEYSTHVPTVNVYQSHRNLDSSVIIYFAWAICLWSYQMFCDRINHGYIWELGAKKIPFNDLFLSSLYFVTKIQSYFTSRKEHSLNAFHFTWGKQSFAPFIYRIRFYVFDLEIWVFVFQFYIICKGLKCVKICLILINWQTV